MGVIGYAAMFEQFHPTDLLTYCEEAEANGFPTVMASDHFHPWTPGQGQSAFVWAWMGALGERTKQRFGTGVTPPGYRYHPAIIAQASATLEAMYPGRFYLGLGAGEDRAADRLFGARFAFLRMPARPYEQHLDAADRRHEQQRRQKQQP